ncbi:hypothetical protein FPQ18DRAFT_408667 [Pyronema domesticum]|nr:hypothetical protein FPQ18DRAFT_408667 [Pyronema domesticum]
MSGFEAAGLVLGLLPIITKGIAALVEASNSSANGSGQILEHLLTNTARGHTPFDTFIDVDELYKGKGWHNADFQNHLRTRLGGEAQAAVFISNVEDLHNELEKIRRYVEEARDAMNIGSTGKTSTIKQMKLPIKILFKQIAGTHKDHMEHIGKINTTLLELTGQSSNFVGGTASQAQIEVVQYYNKLRENSKKLYSLFHEHFPTKCHCIKEYYAAHSANLRLLRFSEKSSTQLKVLFGCDKYHRAPSPSWIELDFIPTECS